MTESGKYRILLMGDASNFHNALAAPLRRMGHDVVVASDGTRWMDTGRDIDLGRRFPGRLGGLDLWMRLNRLMHSRLAGFDFVSLRGSGFVGLRPARIGAIFDRLKAANSHVFVTALATEPQFVEACLAPDSPFRYSEWAVDGAPGPLLKADPDAARQWLAPELKSLSHRVYNEAEGVVTALYEYSAALAPTLPEGRVAYGGIPIETSAIEPVGIPERPEKVRIFLGRHRDRQVLKGTDRLEAAARKVVDELPDRCTLEIVENLPYAEYLERLKGAHVVLDQLYSYTPATNALLAMAMGKVVVSGAEPEYYDFIGEQRLRPIVNAVPDDERLFADLRALVLDAGSLRERGLQGREFVERHNDSEVVGHRFLNFWKSKAYGNDRAE